MPFERALLSSSLRLLPLVALLVAAPASAQTCADGRVADPTGHCCWPGQVFGEQSGQCRGVPHCPPGLVVEGEGCVAPACPFGQLRTPDALHCCWPNQEWSSATAGCIGVAQCPPGTLALPDGGCARAPAPPPPVPAPCNPPDVQRGERCLTPLEVDEEARVARWGSQSLLLATGYTFAGVPAGRLFGHLGSVSVGVHTQGIPLLLSVGGGIGLYRFSEAPCAVNASGCSGPQFQKGSMWSLRGGAAFAPFGHPETRPGDVSPFNPFLGIDVVGVGFFDPDGPRCGAVACLAKPRTTVVPALSVGNAFFLEGQSFVSRLSLSANGDGLILTASFEVPLLFVAEVLHACH